MPRFDVNEDLEIDVDDFLYECDSEDIKKLIEALIENGDLEMKDFIDRSRMSADEQIFEEYLSSISGRWNQLTQEEEETILKIGAKFRYL
jgi:hypothetical protein